jgi:hypothetical protein
MFGGKDAIMRTRYDYQGNYRGSDPELAARVRENTSQMGTPYFDAEHLFNFPHLSGNLAGTVNTDVLVPKGFNPRTVTGPTRDDAVVTIYNAELNITVAAFHVQNFGVTVTKGGAIRLGTTGGPGGVIQAAGIQANQIFILILRLGRVALATCLQVISATRREFRLFQFFAHRGLTLWRTDMLCFLITKRVITLICLLTFSVPAAQTQKPIMVGAENNETSKANLDLLAEVAGKDKIIIFIGRLGAREKSRALNRARLRVAREYLHSTRDIPRTRLVIAEGEEVSNEGRIEAYLDNRLFAVFVFERNKNFGKEP